MQAHNQNGKGKNIFNYGYIMKEVKTDDRFSEKEIEAVLEAIKYQQARKGSFSDADPVVFLREILRKGKSGMSMNNLTDTELALLNEVIVENISFLATYKYAAIPVVDADKLRHAIVDPLNALHRRITNRILGSI